MNLKDIKTYKGYLPIKIEEEHILSWINNLIGNNWIEHLWLNKWSNYHTIRFRFGDINEAQFYMKDKSWHPMSIQLWLKFSEMNNSLLDDKCWQWINNERKLYSNPNKKIYINNNILDI